MAKTTRKNVKLIGNNGNTYDATQSTTTGRKSGRNSWAVKVTIKHDGSDVFWCEGNTVADAKSGLAEVASKHGCTIK